MRVESAKMFLIPSPPKLSEQSCGFALPTCEIQLRLVYHGIGFKQSKFCSARDFPSGRASFRWREPVHFVATALTSNRSSASRTLVGEKRSVLRPRTIPGILR